MRISINNLSTLSEHKSIPYMELPQKKRTFQKSRNNSVSSIRSMDKKTTPMKKSMLNQSVTSLNSAKSKKQLNSTAKSFNSSRNSSRRGSVDSSLRYSPVSNSKGQ